MGDMSKDDLALLNALARFLASQDGQNPDGIYKVAGAPMPAWMGYRDSAAAVLLFLQAKGFPATQDQQWRKAQWLTTKSASIQRQSPST